MSSGSNTEGPSTTADGVNPGSQSMEGVRSNLHAPKRSRSSDSNTADRWSNRYFPQDGGGRGGARRPDHTRLKDESDNEGLFFPSPTTDAGSADGSEGEDRRDGRPDLLNEGHAGSNPYPGAGCVTVAKLQIANRNPMYLNRYGPERYPWFVLSEQACLAEGTSIDRLTDISNKHRRVLDHPIDKEDPKKDEKKFKSSSIKGLLGLVWMFDESTRPMDAIEALNPVKVKRANELPTVQERTKYLRRHQKRLPTYPWTWAWLLFTQKVNGLVDPHEQKGGDDIFDNWELGSKYKDCYRKSLVQKEWELYHSAKRQAERFLAWYERNISASMREGSVLNAVRHRTEDRRFPTIAPSVGGHSVSSVSRSGRTRSSRSGSDTSSNSRSVVDPSHVIPTIEPPPSTTTKRSKSTVARGGRRKQPDPVSRRTALSSPSLPARSSTDVDKRIDNLRSAALEGFKMKRGIRGDLGPEHQEEFDMLWDFAKP